MAQIHTPRPRVSPLSCPVYPVLSLVQNQNVAKTGPKYVGLAPGCATYSPAMGAKQLTAGNNSLIRLQFEILGQANEGAGRRQGRMGPKGWGRRHDADRETVLRQQTIQHPERRNMHGMA